MYGLVNQAIHKLVEESFGPETWEEIRARAGVDDVFITMQQYPDEDTYKLVLAACDVLGAEMPDVLKTFGAFWVKFVSEVYGELFAMSGKSFMEFVHNLNNLHTRVGQMMPELKPPSFKVTNQQDDTFVLHYHSTRKGLSPMIMGLIEGLGRHFKTAVDITHIGGEEQGLDHDEFLVKFHAQTE